MKYCPKCRTEFENWVITCSACSVLLVYELPQELPKIDKEFLEQITDGYNNGHYIIYCIKGGEAGPHYYDAFCYVEGLLDALYHEGQSEKLNLLYGADADNGKIFSSICIYYQNNPSLQYRPAIEVLLEGAK